MKLSLIFNSFQYKLHEENLRVVQKYFGLFPPLSLAWVAAIAERHGHQVQLIDARTLGLTPDEVLRRVRQFQPDLLGYMMTSYMFRETLGWIETIRRGYDAPVVVGGYNLRVYPQESVMPAAIDFGCVNSALHTLPALMAALGGARNFAAVPGLVYKDGGAVRQTAAPPPESFDDYPNPARHLLPNELYAEFPTERRNFTVMVTSKGCPHECVFCEAGRTAYNARRPATVLVEIDQCYREFGIREIDMFDYEFLADRQRSEAILDGLIERGYDLRWSCRTRIDSVDGDLLQKMRRAGCSRIYYGIESASQPTLDALHKRVRLDQVERTIAMTRAQGIKTLGFFLLGVPGETRASARATVRYACRLGLDYAQFSKLTAKPLTGYWRDMVQQTGRDYWREYILGTVGDMVLPRPWMAMSNEELDRETKRAYLRFYCRPLFLLRALLQVRSWLELLRKACALIDMVAGQEAVSRLDRGFRAFNENAYRRLRRRPAPGAATAPTSR
ncbi:MAG TPA: radical SAM protein [bacterium]|nr:radical SAM protein [bacterium]